MINSGGDESIINPTTSEGTTIIPGEGTTSTPDKGTTTPFPDERELSWNEKFPQLWPKDCGKGTLKPKKTKSKRIVNGGEAPPKSIPWQVDIEVIDWRGKDENGNEITSSVPHCGGTIINNDLILTAAHCFKNVNLTMEYNQRAFPIHTIGFGSNQI